MSWRRKRKAYLLLADTWAFRCRRTSTEGSCIRTWNIGGKPAFDARNSSVYRWQNDSFNAAFVFIGYFFQIQKFFIFEALAIWSSLKCHKFPSSHKKLKSLGESAQKLFYAPLQWIHASFRLSWLLFFYFSSS